MNGNSTCIRLLIIYWPRRTFLNMKHFLQIIHYIVLWFGVAVVVPESLVSVLVHPAAILYREVLHTGGTIWWIYQSLHTAY